MRASTTLAFLFFAIALIGLVGAGFLQKERRSLPHSKVTLNATSYLQQKSAEKSTQQKSDAKSETNPQEKAESKSANSKSAEKSDSQKRAAGAAKAAEKSESSKSTDSVKNTKSAGDAKSKKPKRYPKKTGGKYDLSFDDVKFDIEKDGDYEEEMLTDFIRNLVGEKIKIRGYMRPAFKQSGLKTFIFVRDNQECCFGPGAALFDCMIAKMKRGRTADYTVRPIAIEGTFYLKELHDAEGKVRAVFRVKDVVVR